LAVVLQQEVGDQFRDIKMGISSVKECQRASDVHPQRYNRDKQQRVKQPFESIKID
jgi:hypothetical protein